ncbi:MAG: hypothetical protein ABDH19_04005 [Thermodesulfovibrio sp.]
MLSLEQKEYIKKHAYIPEHLPEYVVSISQSEPFLFDEYILYFKDSHLIFIGYPLGKTHSKEDTEKILNINIERFKPKSVALISPFSLISKEKVLYKTSDFYYHLDLSHFMLNSYLKNTIKRALKEVMTQKCKIITEQHIELIYEFVKTRQVDEYTKLIFKKIPDYINLSETVVLFNAIDKKGSLSGFSIADYGADRYAFYMFNFISRRNYVPGVSDLLLYEIIKEAKTRNKLYLNLGLGINKGIEFFKKKWSGEPFLNYEFCLYKVSKIFSLLNTLKKLFPF